jgi:exportin-T
VTAVLRPTPHVTRRAGAAFLSCLEVSLSVPQRLPGNRTLRGRFITFLHRMVECLLSSALPYLPAALEALMASNGSGSSGAGGGGGGGVTDMCDVLLLLVQLVQRFKEGLGKLVAEALPVAVARVHSLLGARACVRAWVPWSVAGGGCVSHPARTLADDTAL